MKVHCSGIVSDGSSDMMILTWMKNIRRVEFYIKWAKMISLEHSLIN